MNGLSSCLDVISCNKCFAVRSTCSIFLHRLAAHRRLFNLWFWVLNFCLLSSRISRIVWSIQMLSLAKLQCWILIHQVLLSEIKEQGIQEEKILTSLPIEEGFVIRSRRSVALHCLDGCFILNSMRLPTLSSTSQHDVFDIATIGLLQILSIFGLLPPAATCWLIGLCDSSYFQSRQSEPWLIPSSIQNLSAQVLFHNNRK